MSSNRQIVKAARAVSSANAAALTRAVVKAAAPRVVQSVTNALKTKNSSKKVNRTRGGQRPVFATEDHWSSQITTPVAYTARWGSGSRPLRVKQSEMVGAIKKDGSWWPFGENGFQVKKFQVNPADSTTFPWLSNIARLFDKYRFHSLTFRYVNTTSTTQQGTFMMGIDYDTLDSPPTSEVAFSQLAKYSAGPVFQPHSMAVPVSHPGNATWLYTYDLNTSSNDPKTYNLGNVFIGLAATSSSWNSGTAGYLFVDYDVEFLDKNPAPTVSKKDDDEDQPIIPASTTTVDTVSGYATDGSTVFTWDTYSLCEYCLSTDGHDVLFHNYTGDVIKAGSKLMLSACLEYSSAEQTSCDSIVGDGVTKNAAIISPRTGATPYICCIYECTLTQDVPINGLIVATDIERSHPTFTRCIVQATLVQPPRDPDSPL